MAPISATQGNAVSLDELYKFEPDEGRANFLNQRMRARLADSLAYVFEEAQSHVGVPRPKFEKFLSQLRNKPVSPVAFSFYCDLVLAIERDELKEASDLMEAMVALPESAGGPSISEFRDNDSTSERIARVVQADPEAVYDIFQPTREAADRCRDQVKSALALIEAGDPALAGEIRGLIQEIILASGSNGPDVDTFDGASSFMLWGGIIVNADSKNEVFDVVQILAHEGAHNLLFAFCVDEPVLVNGFEGRYASPLRTDLRPLEGIYHANFVLARMYRATKNLAESGVFSTADRERAGRAMERQANLFKSGMATIREYGKFTPTGEAVIRGASDYMASVG